jgi:hypothetical protein
MSHADYGACVDCRKAYECGNGSYATSMTHHDTVASFDAELAKHGLTLETRADRAKAWRTFLVEHEGHTFQRWNSDVAYIDDAGDLVLDYDDDLIESGVGGYAWFDWSHEDQAFVSTDQFGPVERPD